MASTKSGTAGMLSGTFLAKGKGRYVIPRTLKSIDPNQLVEFEVTTFNGSKFGPFCTVAGAINTSELEFEWLLADVGVGIKSVAKIEILTPDGYVVTLIRRYRGGKFAYPLKRKVE